MRTMILIAMLGLTATAIAAQPVVNTVSPPRHKSSVTPNTNITAGFSSAMNAPNSGDFRVRSNFRGMLNGVYGGGGTSTLAFDPATDLLPGEEIEVALTTGLQDTGNSNLLRPDVWRFRAATGAGSMILNRVEYANGGSGAWDVEIGDLDGDGDLDMVTVDHGAQNNVFLNDGNGNYTKSPFGPSTSTSYTMALADMDGDGDLDIVVGNWGSSQQTGGFTGQNKIYLNDGSAGFANSVNFGTNTTATIDLDVGDLDGDGDIDIVTANGALTNEANLIYLNDGSVNFTTKQFDYVQGYSTPIQDNSWAVRMGDADNDGDLDVFIGNFSLSQGGVESHVYFNDGSANFDAQHRNTFVSASSIYSLAVGDFDDDGDLDLVAGAATNYWNYIYWNNGSGAFSAQVIAQPVGFWAVEPGDIDGDGDLDIAVGLQSGQSYVIMNTGAQTFNGITPYGPASSDTKAIVFADVDADGDLDIATPDRVCFHGNYKPNFNVNVDGNWLNSGDTVYVNHNDTVASLSIHINVSDPDADNIAVTTQITNLTTQGIVVSEFERAMSVSPHNMYPTSGTFNQGSSTHTFTMTATDSYGETRSFSFNIVVGAATNTPPAIGVLVNSGVVSNGSSVVVPYGKTVSSLGIEIGVNDNDGNPVSLSGSISNLGATGMDVAEFSSASAPAGYIIYPTSGVFNAGSTSHTITLVADDGAGGQSQFQFDFVVGPAPAPRIELFENTVTGLQIIHGASASGGRDFGNQLVNSGQTGVLTVVVRNAGTSTLTVSGVTLTGTDAGEFVLDASNLNATVLSGATTSFTVAFDPNSIGSKSATVSIIHDDTTVTNPFTFAVTGVGTSAAPTPLLVVREGSLTGAVIVNGAGTGGARDFGSHLLGGASAPVTIVIVNAGNGDLNLGTPGVSGSTEFTIDAAGYLAVVPAGGTTSFSVAFDAVTEGNHAATVSFTHNDTSTTSPFSFDVAGTANSATSGGSGSSGGSGGGGCIAAGQSAFGVLFLFAVLGVAGVWRRRTTA